MFLVGENLERSVDKLWKERIPPEKSAHCIFFAIFENSGADWGQLKAMGRGHP